MSYDEASVRWSPAWVAMWILFSIALVSAAFLVPFWSWLTLAGLLFGIPEAIGLLKHKDSLPPLTFVVRRYIPRYIWFPLMYGAFGGIFAFWLGIAHPTRWAAMWALLGWLTDHFTVTYDG